MSVFYVAALARNREGEIFATVPDLPGVNSAAATRGEALALAVEFANDYVRDLISEGHEVPAARDIDDIPVEEEDQEIGRALIPVEVPGKSVKISISIDEALLVRIDRAAEGTGLTRSGFIAAAAEDRIRAGAAAAQRYIRSNEKLYGFSEGSLHSDRYIVAEALIPLSKDDRIRSYEPHIMGRKVQAAGRTIKAGENPEKKVKPRRARKS
jgi:predicted RNase H-like HicB family nuclease